MLDAGFTIAEKHQRRPFLKNNEKSTRYLRQVALPEIGRRGQQKLAQTKVLVVGLGGLGSPAALYLAGAGIGRLGLCDIDRVEESNLPRQVLYSHEDIDKPKVEAAKHRLTAYAPELETELFADGFTEAEPSDEILKNYDLILDCSDNQPCRYLINRRARTLGISVVYAAIHRFEGQVAVFNGRGGPCYNCLFPQKSNTAMVPDCAQAGVIGVLPGIIGCHQALEALKIILELGESLEGRLLLFNALNLDVRKLKIPEEPLCEVCGTETKAESEQISKKRSRCGSISASELRRAIAGDESEIILLDVRQPEEYLLERIEGSVTLPLDELDDRIESLDKDKSYVLYCRSGARSRLACERLVSAGFQRVKNLTGGYLAWSALEPV